MALNLGTEAMQAANDLHKHGDSRDLFQRVRDGLHQEVRKKMNAALDAGPEDRHMAIGYARALRDVFVALDSAALNGAAQVRGEQPAPVSKHAAAR